MKNPLVSIIIVNWNGLNHLEKLLPSLTKVNYSPFEVIIVDNASDDNSVNFVNKNYPTYKVVKNKINLGFAKGNNVGVKHAKGEYLLFLNNDTEVTQDFLSILVREIKSSNKLGIVQPKILLLEKKDTLDSIGSFLTSTGFLNHYGFEEKDTKLKDKKIYLFSAKGACFLMRKELFNAVGGFDNDYVNYFEETDLCWRVWLNGKKILYVPAAKIYHKGWGSSTKLGLYAVTYHSFKNRINCLLKNLAFINLVKILPLHFLTCIFISLVYAISLKFSNTWGIYCAVFWNIRNLSNTIKKRDIIQSRIRKNSDSEIFKYIFKDKGVTYYFLILYTSLVRSSYLKKTEKILPNLKIEDIQTTPIVNPKYSMFNPSYTNIKTKNYYLDNWQIAYFKRIYTSLDLKHDDAFLNLGFGNTSWIAIEAARTGVRKIVSVEMDNNMKSFQENLANKTLSSSDRKKLEFLVCKKNKLKFKNNTFTKACSISLLDHEKEFEIIINEFSRVMKMDAKLYICLSNTYKDTPLLLKPLNRKNDKIIGHSNSFSPKKIIKIFRKYGFKEEELIYHSHIIKLLQVLLTFISPKFNKVGSRSWWLLEKIDQMQKNNPHAMNFSVVFRKIK